MTKDEALFDPDLETWRDYAIHAAIGIPFSALLASVTEGYWGWWWRFSFGIIGWNLFVAGRAALKALWKD